MPENNTERGRTSRIASGPFAQWRQDDERTRAATQAMRRRGTDAARLLATISGQLPQPKTKPHEQADKPRTQLKPTVNTEPLLYHWQRQGELSERLAADIQDNAPNDKDEATVLAVGGLFDHYTALMRTLPATLPSDMTAAHESVAAITSYTTPEGTVALQQRYNMRALELGKQLFDLTGEMRYTTLELPETVAAEKA